jgi:hypothetical protein
MAGGHAMGGTSVQVHGGDRIRNTVRPLNARDCEMADQPSLIERVPQLFSVAVGLFVGAMAFLWDVSKALGVIMAMGALASLVLRLWIPVHRRRKYGY